MSRYVSYIRVSTSRQACSGLGLEAQVAAVQALIAGHEHIGQFIEVESGRNCDRPELKKAIVLARKMKAVIVIAKLDRLARNVAFVSALLDSGAEFAACDMPQADRMMLQIVAVFAEHEAKMISERTKAALQAARARGVRLGNCKNLKDAQAKAQQTLIAQADAHAAKTLPTIRDVVHSGVFSVHKIADALNNRGIATRRGGSWTGTGVLNIVKRSGFSNTREILVS